MTDERCKQIMEQLGMPESRSLMQAIYQVANETEQEVRKKLTSDNSDYTKCSGCRNSYAGSNISECKVCSRYYKDNYKHFA